MNFAEKSIPTTACDTVVATVIAQLQEKVEAKDRVIAEKEQALQAASAIIEQLKEALRMERIRKYGKHSEKLSDLQLQLLDLEPAVSSEEVEHEAESGPLPGKTKPASRRRNQHHPGRNGLPAHLPRVEEIVACAEKCDRCGGETKVIGYEVKEELAWKPAEPFVRVVKREKRVCLHCREHGVATAPPPARIAPKSIFADETVIEFLVRKYADGIPLFRQRAILERDLEIDIALTTIDDAVLRAGELLIPVVHAMKRDLLSGGYIQADETYIGVQTPEKTGENHRAFFWQYSAPGKGAVFDFEMTRRKQVAEKLFRDYGGILQTDGYVAYEKDLGTKDLVHACCWSHARRGFVDALKVQKKGKASDARLERVVALIDGLFAIDREARDGNLSLDARQALRQERAPALLDELYALLRERDTAYLPKSVAGKAVHYTLKRWTELTQFLRHPVIELSTNWAENSMRPIAIGRRNWLHLGSKEAGPKIAAIFSVVESCRRLGVPIRRYLAEVLPGLADRSIHALAEFTPAAYAAKPAK
jgi:transposase